jgi:hypothetical protein
MPPKGEQAIASNQQYEIQKHTELSKFSSTYLATNLHRKPNLQCNSTEQPAA